MASGSTEARRKNASLTEPLRDCLIVLITRGSAIGIKDILRRGLASPPPITLAPRVCSRLFFIALDRKEPNAINDREPRDHNGDSFWPDDGGGDPSRLSIDGSVPTGDSDGSGWITAPPDPGRGTSDVDIVNPPVIALRGYSFRRIYVFEKNKNNSQKVVRRAL